MIWERVGLKKVLPVPASSWAPCLRVSSVRRGNHLENLVLGRAGGQVSAPSMGPPLSLLLFSLAARSEGRPVYPSTTESTSSPPQLERTGFQSKLRGLLPSDLWARRGPDSDSFMGLKVQASHHTCLPAWLVLSFPLWDSLIPGGNPSTHWQILPAEGSITKGGEMD